MKESAAEPERIGSFWGLVDVVEGDTVYVIFADSQGDICSAHCNVEMFSSKEIREGDGFTIVKHPDPKLSSVGHIQLQLIPRTKITPEEAKEIREKCERAFPGDTLDILF